MRRWASALLGLVFIAAVAWVYLQRTTRVRDEALQRARDRGAALGAAGAPATR